MENKSYLSPIHMFRRGHKLHNGKVSLLLCLLVSLFLFAVSSCNHDDPINLEPTVYTVTFETDGGTEIAVQSVNEGEKAVIPDPAPTKEYYNFGGWYTDKACSTEFNFETAINSNITLYAKWIVEDGKFEVKFDTAEGGSSVATQVLEENQKATKPADPTREHYKFDGWYADKEYTTLFDFDTELSQTTTIYAKWIAICTVTFSGADIPSQTVELGQKITKPDDPVPSGDLHFGGWYINEDYTVQFDFDSPIVEDKTIYAKWLDSWIVTFSGASSIEPVSVKNNQKVTKPENPADTETQIFDGWYTDAAYTTPFDFDTKITKNTTIYAKWLPIYTVSFDSVYGSSVDPIKVAQGKKASKPIDPTRKSRTFAGWYKDSAYKNAFDFATDTITRDITLYAKWNMPDGVDNAITMNVEKGQLDVTYSPNTNSLLMQNEYTFTCNDGPADWYLNNKLVKSNSSEYMYKRTYFQQTGIITVEARKVINDIVYTWTAVCSM